MSWFSIPWTLAEIQQQLSAIFTDQKLQATQSVQSAQHAAQNTQLAAILHNTKTIIGYFTPAPSLAVKIRLALPTVTKKGILMANYPLPNDEVVAIQILTDDIAGDPVPPPPGDTFAAVCSIPASLNAVVSGSILTINALVAGHLNPPAPADPDLFVTVTDSAGIQKYVLVVDIVADTAPKAIMLDLANAVVTPQPVPSNPGP